MVSQSAWFISIYSRLQPDVDEGGESSRREDDLYEAGSMLPTKPAVNPKDTSNMSSCGGASGSRRGRLVAGSYLVLLRSTYTWIY